jgi:transcriptional regulator with XRE-family HTH domain
MLDATEFGKILRELMAKNNLRQEQLAKELGVSPSILSNYITGKNIPEMDFLAKCVDRFALKGKDLKPFFEKAYLSSVQSSHKIVLDTSYFREDRLDILLQALVVLQLRSDNRSSSDALPPLMTLINSIKNTFEAMDTADAFLELVRPSQDDK